MFIIIYRVCCKLCMSSATRIFLYFVRLQVRVLLTITMSCFVQKLVFEKYTQ